MSSPRTSIKSDYLPVPPPLLAFPHYLLISSFINLFLSPYSLFIAFSFPYLFSYSFCFLSPFDFLRHFPYKIFSFLFKHFSSLLFSCFNSFYIPFPSSLSAIVVISLSFRVIFSPAFFFTYFSFYLSPVSLFPPIHAFLFPLYIAFCIFHHNLKNKPAGSSEASVCVYYAARRHKRENRNISFQIFSQFILILSRKRLRPRFSPSHYHLFMFTRFAFSS